MWSFIVFPSYKSSKSVTDRNGEAIERQNIHSEILWWKPSVCSLSIPSQNHQQIQPSFLKHNYELYNLLETRACASMLGKRFLY